MKTTALGISLLFLAGCAHVAQYEPRYVASSMQHFSPTVTGKALVITDAAQDEQVYAVHPSSLTGATSTFQATVGAFLRDVFLEVFSHTFSNGSSHAHERSQEAGTATVVVKPQLLTFDYRYNQLKNLGLMITPEARVQVRVAIADGEGRPLSDQTYDSGFVSGGSYALDFKPAEKINRALHRALVTIAEAAAKDAGETLSRQRHGQDVSTQMKSRVE